MSDNQRQAGPEFRRSEFFETLIRVRDTQPRRYAREVSPGLRRRVELYEEQKARCAADSPDTARHNDYAGAKRRVARGVA